MEKVFKAIKNAFLRFISPRYFETTCFLIPRIEIELELKNKSETTVFCLIELSTIELVREVIDNRETECMLCFKSGESLVIGHGYDQVRSLLINRGYL